MSRPPHCQSPWPSLRYLSMVSLRQRRNRPVKTISQNGNKMLKNLFLPVGHRSCGPSVAVGWRWPCWHYYLYCWQFLPSLATELATLRSSHPFDSECPILHIHAMQSNNLWRVIIQNQEFLLQNLIFVHFWPLNLPYRTPTLLETKQPNLFTCMFKQRRFKKGLYLGYGQPNLVALPRGPPGARALCDVSRWSEPLSHCKTQVTITPIKFAVDQKIL
jgi:hypothetical protein